MNCLLPCDSYARDRALPGFFDDVSKRWECPIRTSGSHLKLTYRPLIADALAGAVWLGVFLSFCLALPSLGSLVAFSAATSIATIGPSRCVFPSCERSS